ncbi:MAG: SpoIIE family protein phosphatase [Spirochaetia bacterium]
MMTKRTPAWRLLACMLVLIIFPAAGKLGAQELSLEDNELFFEQPRRLVEENSYFPLALSDGDDLYILYQEVIRQGEEEGEIYISMAASERGREWEENSRIAGPISYEGENPPVVFSAEITDRGDIYVVVLESATTTRILVSRNGGDSFSTATTLETERTSVAPRLFSSANGGLLLFVNQNVGATQSILYSYSGDGRQWSELEEFVDEDEVGFNFLPDHASVDGRDYVVFQSVDPNEAPTYQLFLKQSENGGRTWTEPELISDFTPRDEQTEYLEYDNQRPFLHEARGELELVWERRRGAQTRQIFYTSLSPDGSLLDRPEELTPGRYPANFPQIFRFDGESYVLFFRERSGQSEIAVAKRERGRWLDRTLSTQESASTFGSPIVHRDRVHVFWQDRTGEEQRRVAYLEPDQRVRPPEVQGENFVEGRRSSQDRAEFSWDPPDDPSGIDGYSVAWSQDPDADVPQEVEYQDNTRSADFAAEEDGPWYLRIAAKDRAGNWSQPETIRYYRDTTPPPPVSFEEPETDDEGFLSSNTFTIDWEPPEEADDVAGYSVGLRRLGAARADEPQEFNASVQLPERVVTDESSLSRNNIDNGLWALSVAPVDEVGNVGEPRTLFLRLNKYVPVTEVHRVAADRDMLNRYELEIAGRGFTANGEIDRIIIDEDGEEPYDHVFRYEDGDYELSDNRTIDGLRIDNIETGNYRIILSHTDRGLHRVSRTLSFEAPGTVTFGDYRLASAPGISIRDEATWQFYAWNPLVWVAVALLGLMAVFSSTRLVSVAREGRQLQLEVRALLESKPMPVEQKKRRLEVMAKRRTSLRVKFTVFVVVLVVSVILAVALILGNAALERQERTLAAGLEQRAEVLLDSVTNQAEDLLDNPGDNRVELTTLANQADIMDEGLYITITGAARNGDGFDAVWTTSDPALREDGETSALVERSLDTDGFVAGESRVEDPVADIAAELEDEINQEARRVLGDIPTDLADVRDELTTLLQQGVSSDDPELVDLDETQRELQRRQQELLAEVGSVVGSYPEFTPEELSREDTEYVFYQPVVFARAQDDPETAAYYRGMVRLGISTELILEEIESSQRELIISTGIVALGALGGGIAGALVLATIVVIPIRRLVEGVTVIRDTEQKERLKGHVINVRTRDELSVLAETVNSMTQGLVRAAEANKDLTVGKEVQKKFIPLTEDAEHRKMTMAREDMPEAEFAGYYEGAKGVSGDYFQYQKLDSNHYALIKCDIAGKGVSAALIMVQVATLFTNYFRAWSFKKNGLALGPFVNQVNDIIASIGFEGRFAAFTAGILNIKTGSIRLCNAGDTKVHIYEKERREVIEHDLPPAPAAGVFSSDSGLIPNGFPEIDHQLQVGDILLLFTDGVEEAKRKLRDKNYHDMNLSEDDVNAGRVPEGLGPMLEDKRVTRKESGELEEEFGVPRIHEIATAFENRRRYRLEKVYNPDGDEELVFDFSDVEPTLDQLVLALVAVEKIFRLYRPSDVTQDDRVQIDVKIDDFLKKHFRQYDRFFRYEVSVESETHYRYYARLREDEQYDDLTCLAVRKR